MSAAADVGFGASITFGTSAFSARLKRFSFEASREAVDVTHMGSTKPTGNEFGGREYIPQDVADPGELEFEILFNPDSYPPINGDPETITVAWELSGGDATPASLAFTGFVTSMSPVVEMDDAMMSTIRVKMTGVATPTAGA